MEIELNVADVGVEKMREILTRLWKEHVESAMSDEGLSRLHKAFGLPKTRMFEPTETCVQLIEELVERGMLIDQAQIVITYVAIQTLAAAMSAALGVCDHTEQALRRVVEYEARTCPGAALRLYEIVSRAEEAAVGAGPQ